MPLCQTGTRMPGLILAPVTLLALAAAAAGQDKAPRHPPEPFTVFIHARGPADPASHARLDEALPVVRERIERRRWFALAESVQTADITLRITHYRQGHPEAQLRPGQLTCYATEYNYLDAVVRVGDLEKRLSGMDHRCVDEGPSLRNAAGHLAEELERFAKDNYGALSRVRTDADARQRRDDTPPNQPRN